jgi:2-keto-4-pentenoate hydratase/2-oxohepta-3-ene-1,7-dioic acid hydratase in catechol pathway
MKLISYSDTAGSVGFGVIVNDLSFVDLTQAGISGCMIDIIERYDALKAEIATVVAERRFVRPLAKVNLEAPIPKPRRNLFCVGKNYLEHAAEFGSSGFDAGAIGGNEVPEYPIIFSKPGSVIIGP